VVQARHLARPFRPWLVIDRLPTASPDRHSSDQPAQFPRGSNQPARRIGLPAPKVQAGQCAGASTLGGFSNRTLPAQHLPNDPMPVGGERAAANHHQLSLQLQAKGGNF